MRIAEIYRSVQGEGILTGTPSTFVRTSGCNLRCWFCDTPYASWKPEGEDRSVEEVFDAVSRLEAEHVVLTGGEPMLFSELRPLCNLLRQAKFHITIETSGTLYLPLECDLISISPKLANSTPSSLQSPRWHDRHEKARHTPDIVAQLILEHDYQLKFVVDKEEDLEEIQVYLGALANVEPSKVFLMPQGIEIDELNRTGTWLEHSCRHHGFQFCPRKQIEWFGPLRGT